MPCTALAYMSVMMYFVNVSVAFAVDGPLKMFRTAARNTRLFGYAGPSTGKATEVFSKYIITDMYAKAVQGMKAEDAVQWADTELKKIYGS